MNPRNNGIKQNINLYLPRFRPPQLSDEIRSLVRSFIIVFCIILVSSITLASLRFLFQSQLEQAQHQQEILNNKLNTVIAQIPDMTIDKALEDHIERGKQLLGKQRKVISFLRQDSINEGSSFTPLVEQLSQQNVKGVWLSKFEVTNQGKDIELTGFSKTPERVSKYLAMLGEKSAYQGRVFKQIKVTRSKKAWNEFFLSTQEEKKDETLISAEELPGVRL